MPFEVRLAEFLGRWFYGLLFQGINANFFAKSVVAPSELEPVFGDVILALC